MENLSYIGLSQQMALSRQMDITANNIANMNTPGFKGEAVLFKEYVNKTPSALQKISQVQDAGTYRNFAQGSLSQTSNSLDAAIEGKGYFAVQTPEGARYTRDGSFSLNANGEVVTKAGYKLMGDGGAIVIPQGSSAITISGDGSVSTDQGTAGKLKVVSFADEQKLQSIGNNLFDAKGMAEKPAEGVTVHQGMIEGSNIQPITEMNRMIQISRLYQAAQHMLLTDHGEKLKMIQHLTQA